MFISQNNHFWVNHPIYNIHNKNQRLEFLFDNEKEYYNKHIASNKNHHYYTKKIVYSLDDNGFRKYDLPKRESKILCFGCSCTFGLGLADEETWPYIFSSLLNFEYEIINFSTIGGSSDSIARILHQSIDIYNPKYVLILFPDMYRKEYVTKEGGVVNFSFSTQKNDPYMDGCREEYNGYLKMLNENEAFFNFIKNLNFINGRVRVPFLWSTWCSKINSFHSILSRYVREDNFVNIGGLNTSNNARDGIHPGWGYNREVADLYYKKFTTLYNKDN